MTTRPHYLSPIPKNKILRKTSEDAKEAEIVHLHSFVKLTCSLYWSFRSILAAEVQ